MALFELCGWFFGQLATQLYAHCSQSKYKVPYYLTYLTYLPKFKTPDTGCVVSIYSSRIQRPCTGIKASFIVSLKGDMSHIPLWFHFKAGFESRTGSMNPATAVVLWPDSEPTNEWERREIIYCKRAILSLSSSKILTPPSPSPHGECVFPPNKGGGYTRRAERGRGGLIFWKTREIGLPSYSK